MELIPGLCYGIWLFFVLDPVEVTVFGLNVYMLRNTILMMDFVRHTHLKFPYGKFISAILISPHYHQLHHSTAQKDLDKNFGLTLTVWDWMFGTLAVPEPDEDFVFGLTDNEHDEYQSLYRLHISPSRRSAAACTRRSIVGRNCRPISMPGKPYEIQGRGRYRDRAVCRLT